MNICIIGGGLTSLSLAKNLINKKINVQLYQENKTKNLFSSRTIGISKKNIEFFTKEIQNISKKILWKIKKIEIYSEKLEKENLIKFENNKDSLFYIVKNDDLYKLLLSKMSQNKFFKKRVIKKSFYNKVLKKNKYDLIINCETNNLLSKKYFTKKIYKDYLNFAYTTILEHKETKNNTATQIFTKTGPIAFLPISKRKTSIVFSLDTQYKKYSNSEVLNMIIKNNPKYQIKKIQKLNSFKLSFSNLRNYHHKNILAFGDLLHKIHPLAGQGFNMSIRDIKILSKIIQNKIDLGMSLDESILYDFEKKTKTKNFIFSNSIDFIYEIFNLDRKNKSKGLTKIIKIIGGNKILSNYFIKLADQGIKI